MFNKFIRYFNQNRLGVITTIIIILAVIALIQLLNSFAKQNEKEQYVNVINNTISSNQSTSNKSSNVLHTSSQITGDKITDTQAKSNQNLIANFIKLCNNKDANNAYTYLSANCKEELFSTVNDFKTQYIDKIFNNEKTYNIENWKASGNIYTYKITYIENMLASGKTSNSIEDYITIVTENNTNKLNIFRYITNEKINKTAANNIASITVLEKNVYDDYEIYKISITNNSNNTIMLNRTSDNGGIYVQYSGSNAKYTAFISEIIQSNLSINAGQTKYLSIKINKVYNGAIQAKSMVFSDIINNKNTFDSTSDKTQYKDISNILVNF